MGCLNCGKELIKLPKKREKIFCDNTCRSNYWQKAKRLSDSGRSDDEIAKILFVKPNKPIVEPKDKNTTDASTENKSADNELKKHQLWKSGDPAEGSGAFFMKYNCLTYSELLNLKK